MTTRVGIFAYPAGHTASPAMHNSAFSHLGLSWTYEAFEVKPEELKAAVERIRNEEIRGINVTIPHKVSVIPFLDEISDNAKLIGAVNTIINDQGILKGDNTDGFGFAAALKEGLEKGQRLQDLAPSSAVLLGAGGAARAVAVSLGMMGVKTCGIFDVEISRAQDLKEHLEKKFPDLRAECLDQKGRDRLVPQVKLIVNCSPVGMKKFPGTPVDPGLITKEHVVFDLVYNPEWTQFRRDCEKRGALAIGGLDMLVWQGAKAFELWTGKAAPVDVMRQAAAEFLQERG